MAVGKRGKFSVEDPFFGVFWPQFSLLSKQMMKQQQVWIVLIITFVYFQRLKWCPVHTLA
jgi:hypothetical protein